MRRSLPLLTSLLFSLLLAPVLAAQPAPMLGGGKIATDIKPQDVIFWDASAGSAYDGGKVVIGLRMTAKQDWTIYKKNLEISGPTGYTLESAKFPDTRNMKDPISGDMVDVYFGGDFELTFIGPETWTEDTFPVNAKYVGCTKVICLFPYTATVNAKVYQMGADTGSSAGDDASATAAIPDNDGPTISEAAGTAPGDATLEGRLVGLMKDKKTGFSILLLAVFLGGLLSNLTPCVYPMIPITLRLLGGQGQSPYLGATAYAGGIVVTYTALGLAATAGAGMFGAMMASTSFNVIFAVVMGLLGLTMLGFGNFSKLQMIGNRIGAGKPSLRNKFLMGTGAGLVASPCTGPILAALIAYTAKSHTVAESSFLMFAYSFGFGLPYIALGGAAAKASQVKVPHHVQVGVKLFFAAVMFALCFYYLRVPFYGLTKVLRDSWWLITSVALPLGLLASIAWVIVPRLQHDKLSMILPTTVLGLGVFAASQWMSIAPQSELAKTVKWHSTEETAYAAAAETGRPMLIDMWADWCEACKKMDRTTFQDERVLNELAQNWVILKLDLTESNDENDAIQEKYELNGLPTLVLIPPSGDLEKRISLESYQSADDLLKHLRSVTAAE